MNINSWMDFGKKGRKGISWSSLFRLLHWFIRFSFNYMRFLCYLFEDIKINVRFLNSSSNILNKLWKLIRFTREKYKMRNIHCCTCELYRENLLYYLKCFLVALPFAVSSKRKKEFSIILHHIFWSTVISGLFMRILSNSS